MTTSAWNEQKNSRALLAVALHLAQVILSVHPRAIPLCFFFVFESVHFFREVHVQSNMVLTRPSDSSCRRFIGALRPVPRQLGRSSSSGQRRTEVLGRASVHGMAWHAVWPPPSAAGLVLVLDLGIELSLFCRGHRYQYWLGIWFCLFSLGPIGSGWDRLLLFLLLGRGCGGEETAAKIYGRMGENCLGSC